MVASSGYRWVRSILFERFSIDSCFAHRVDAQWITAKKDWDEAKRRYKTRENTKDSDPALETKPVESGQYEQDMDEMRCILYAHGGVFSPFVIDSSLL